MSTLTARKWFYGWVIVFVVFVGSFISSGAGGITVSLFFDPIRETQRWTLTQLTGGVTAQGIAILVAAPIIGPLLDRFGARIVMTSGAIVAGIGLMLLSNMQEIWHFWLLFAIVGSLSMTALGDLAGPVVVAKWFIRKRGIAMALATSGGPAGGMIMSPLVALLISLFGWRDTWQLMGLTILLFATPIILLLMRRTPEDLGLLPDGTKSIMHRPPNDDQPPYLDESTWTLSDAIRTRTLWIIVVSMNLVTVGATSLLYHQVPYFRSMGMSAQDASYIFTLTLLGATTSRFFWGFIAERIPIRLCLFGVFLCRSLGVLSLVIIPYPQNILSFISFFGFLGGTIWPMQALAMANYYGRRFLGSIQGLLRPLLGISQIVGPIFIAILFDTTGNFKLGFLIASSLGITGSFLVLLATPPKRSQAHVLDNL